MNIQKELPTYVGIYCRLSKDDGNVGESGSIQNQKDFLKEYAMKLGWKVVATYVDDGYSGTNFNRPGFQNLLSDIEKKRINCILTKDLSRFGRNYILSGYYLEEYFPQNHIRCVAVNDNYDSLLESNTEFAPLKNIINEWYAKDISKKIKFSLKGIEERGEIRKRGTVLFGYLQDEQGNRTPDPDASIIVQQIFQKYIEFKNLNQVARYLTESHIPCPAYYDYLHTGSKACIYENCLEEKKYAWTRRGVTRILKNEQYLGHLITAQSHYLSFKVKKKIMNPTPLIFENKFEPIISKELFNQAQRILKAYSWSLAPEGMNTYKRMLVCSTCGKPLVFGFRKEKKTEYSKYIYYCRNKSCTQRPLISKMLLDEIFKKELNEMVSYILSHQENFLEFTRNYTKDKNLQKNIFEINHKQQLLMRKKELEQYIEGTFKAQLEGDITKEMYQSITSGYKKELEEINLKLNLEVQEIKNMDVETNAICYLARLKQLKEIDVVDTSVISTFCEQIRVKVNKITLKNFQYEITINYGALDDCIKGFIHYGE